MRLPTSTTPAMKNPFLNALLYATLSASLMTLAAPAAAQQDAPAHVDLATGLRFPRYLAQLRFQEMRIFPNTKLGYCVMYASAAANGQVCVYDLGYEGLPTGIDSPGFKEGLRIATEAFLHALNNPPYANGQVIGEGTPSVKVDGKTVKAELRLLSSEVTRPDQGIDQGKHLLLMTGGLGKILKLNYSERNVTQEVFAAAAERLIDDFVRYNEATMKTLLLEPDRPGK